MVIEYIENVIVIVITITCLCTSANSKIVLVAGTTQGMPPTRHRHASVWGRRASRRASSSSASCHHDGHHDEYIMDSYSQSITKPK